MRTQAEHVAIVGPISGSARMSVRANAYGQGVSAMFAAGSGGRASLVSIHFDANKYSAEDARGWLKRHSFNPSQFVASERGTAKAYDPSVDTTAAYDRGLILPGNGEAIEIMAAADVAGGKKLRGFKMTAYTGAAMRLDGFYRPVVVDLSGMKAASSRIPALRDHDPRQIVGHFESVDITAQRIYTEGIMSGVGDAAKEVNELADNGFPWQASIGAQTVKMEYVEAGNSAKANGRNFDGPVLIARASVLREISFVPLGADPATSARVQSR